METSEAEAKRANQTAGKRSGGALAPTRAGSLAARIVYVLSGSVMLAGFFMPWIKLGDLVSLTGLGLALSEGQAVSMLTGSGNFLLLAVPVFGLLLLLGGIFAFRGLGWLSVLGAVVIFGYGFYTAMTLFLSSTGLGMWLVIAATFLASAFGLVSLGKRTSE